jgi:hypothetical protein
MVRHAALLATMLALSTATAHADSTQEPSQLAILAGPGVRAQRLRADTYSETRMLPSLAATVANRFRPDLAVGIHVNVARYTDQVWHPDESSDWSYLSLDLAIAVQYERDRFAVTPWLGRHLTRVHSEGEICDLPRMVCMPIHELKWTDDATSVGLTASFLPLRSTPVAVFLALQASTGGTELGPGFTYSAATLGVAYHH